MHSEDSKLRILIVSEDVPHPSMGGLGQHAVNLAKGLARAGHSVDFMGSQRFPYDESARQTLDLPGKMFPDLFWRFGSWKEQRLGFFNPMRRAVLARDFARVIMKRAADYDVVHYHGHVPDVAAFIPKEVNFVQTRHDQGGDCLTHVRFRNNAVCAETDPSKCAACIAEQPSTLQTALSALAVMQHRDRVKVAFQRHKTVFVSDMLRRNFERTAGPGPWGTVVHNFMDAARLERAAATPRRPDNVSAWKHVIVCASKLYEPKGVEPFLEGLASRMPADTCLVVIGDGPQEADLRERHEGNQVRFLGWRPPEETLEWTAGADAMVVPSIWEEPCATTVFEGLALGKPTYALRRGGTPELRAYERYAGQLRLAETMQLLVDDVLATTTAPPTAIRQVSRNVDSAISELIPIYRS
jgi:glycosyltransferase involved in cell wall biosynthesis